MDIDKVLRTLEKEVKNYKVPVAELVEAQTKEPFNVLLATILAARTNDKTTTAVVKKLFKEVKHPKDLRRLSEKDVQDLIYPVGFYRNKARQLKQLGEMLDSKEIPETMDGLLELPGVGRKTANLVLAVAFRIPAICVDVHVHRIMNRLGYVRTRTPFDTEMALRKKLPKKHWLKVNYILVAYGQNLCTPVRPWCSKCKVYDECRRIGVVANR